MGKAALVLLAWVGMITPALAQSTATIAAKTCTLTMSASKSPDGTSGWSVQFKRGTSNQGVTDSTAPYGPRSATVDAGTYALTAVWTKAGKTVTEDMGSARCAGGAIVPPAPVPAPTPTPTPTPGASPDGTVVPPASSLTDGAGNVWTLGAESAPGFRYVLCNGALVQSGYASAVRYLGGVVSVLGSDGVWYPTPCGTGAPVGGATGPPAPPSDVAVTKTKTLVFVPVASEYQSLVTRFVMQVTDAAGVVAQASDIGKPPLDATGQVSLPVALTLVVGRAYQLAVGACADALCGPFSPGFGFVFQ